MIARSIRLAFALFATVLFAQSGNAQTPGEAPRPEALKPAALDEGRATELFSAATNAGAERAATAAYSRVAASRRHSAFLQQERKTIGQVADAHLDFYPSTEYLRILGSPGRPALIAPPFHARTKAEAGSASMPGVPGATLSRLYRSDSSVAALMAWYEHQYGFDFRVHVMPLGNAGHDTMTIARAVRQIDNSVVTVMIWTPSSPRGRSAQSSGLTRKTSVEVQERAFRPRNELVAEGPDAVVELTWKVPYRDLIQRISHRYQIDPHLVAALVQQESNFNPTAMSVDSAMGLTQMIPGTAAMLGVTDPTNPRQALDGGIRYLKMLLRRFKGNVEFALAGYNAGPGNVQKYGGIPPFAETRDYVRRIMARYKEKAAGAFAASAKVVRKL